MVEALPDVFAESLPGALADVAGSGDGALAWGGMGGGAAAAGCEGVASLAAGAGEVGALTLGAVVADMDSLALGAGGATSLEAVDALGIGSVADLPLLLAEAVTLFELDAWRTAFAVSFAGLTGFSGAVTFACDSIGAAVFAVSGGTEVVLVVSVVASFIVVAEFAATLVSARFACGFAIFAVRAGLAPSSWPTRWSSTTAPPIATAVMTPKAMPKWFTLFSGWL